MLNFLPKKSRLISSILSIPKRPLDIPFYASVVESCALTRNLKKLKQAHAQVISVGISHLDFIKAKLIYSYATCGQMHECIYVFSVTNRQSTFLYNCMIRGYASLNLFQDSINVYHQMLLAGKHPDRHTLPTVLKSCAGLSALHLGRKLHVLVLVNGFSTDVATSNSLITMYSKCGDLSTARKVFDEMLERNLITWSAMIAGYGIHGNTDEVFKLFEDMLEDGESPDGVTFIAILASCNHGGLMDIGRGFFEMMEWRFGVKPGLKHYTCMVNMLGRAGHIDEAEALISRIGIEPDDALWSALLGACKLHGKMEVAMRVAEKFYGRLVLN